MKRLLYILLLINGTVFGQTEFGDVTSTPSSATSDETIIVRSGTTYRVTRAVQQDDLYDSIQISTDTAAVHDGKINTNIQSAGDNSDSIDASGVLIDANVSDISTTSGNLTTEINNSAGTAGMIITFDGDTMTVTSKGTIMKFTKTSGTTVDTDPPYYLYGECGNLGYDTVSTIYNESITWNTPDTADFKVTVDLFNAVITGVYHIDDELRFKIDSSVSVNESVIVSYIQPSTNRITDATGNYLQSFSTGIVNNVSAATTPVKAHYLFENNPDDETGNYGLTATDGATYTSSSPIQGTYSADLDGADRYFAVPSIPYGPVHTTCLWVKVWDGGSTVRTLFSTLQSDDGIEINYNFNVDRIESTTGNGSSTTMAYSTSGLGYVSGTPFHVAVVYNKTSGASVIYFNGVDVTSVSSTRTDYTTTSIGRIGLNFAGEGDLYGFLDDVQIYDAGATSENIDSIYNNKGVSVNIGGGDNPVPDDSIEVITHVDFTSTAVQRGLTEAELLAIHSPYWYLGGELDDECETAGVVDHSGNKWLRSYHDINTSGVEADGAISNGGSGLSWQVWMNTNQNDDYSNGYLTYTAKFPAGFVTGDGGKMPGVITYEDYPFQMTLAPMITSGSSIRTMHKLNVADSVDVMWYIYPHLYANYQYGQTHSRPGSGLSPGMIDRFPMDTEVKLTIRWFSGDTGVKNGFVEWFRDGVLIDQWTGLNFTESSSINFNALAIDTFFGGSGVGYYAPSSTYWDARDFVFFQYPFDTNGVPNYNVPSSPGRVLNQPAEAL